MKINASKQELFFIFTSIFFFVFANITNLSIYWHYERIYPLFSYGSYVCRSQSPDTFAGLNHTSRRNTISKVEATARTRLSPEFWVFQKDVPPYACTDINYKHWLPCRGPILKRPYLSKLEMSNDERSAVGTPLPLFLIRIMGEELMRERCFKMRQTTDIYQFNIQKNTK